MNTEIVTKQIPVSIDKSHLVTIGERLYTEKIDLIRELVSNAYDADAARVDVLLEERRLIVRDNGSGMDEKGLHTYFTIGSQNKKQNAVSSKFKRHRIGEFGIGKFAALSACKVFSVETQRGSFHARLLFDKNRWQEHQSWHVDTQVLPYNPDFAQGTEICLIDMEQQFSLARVRRYLRERVPMQVPNFEVYVNGEQLEEEFLQGREHSFQTATDFGIMSGRLVLTNTPWSKDDAGIGIYVKNILITKETFGLEIVKKSGATRIRGKIQADFLPITSSRDSVIVDSAEYGVLCDVVQKEIKKLLKVAQALADRRADERSSQALKDAMERIGKVLHKQEVIKMRHDIPMGESAEQDGGEEGVGGAGDDDLAVGYDLSQARFLSPGVGLSEEMQKRLAENKKKSGGRKSGVALGRQSIIRKLKFQNTEMAVRLEHLRDDEESLLSGGVIYINLDHPLYRLYHQDDSLLTAHIARLITKELALQLAPGSAVEAFRVQSSFLTEAFRHVKKL